MGRFYRKLALQGDVPQFAKLANISPISMVFVGDISNYIELVNGIINIYKPFISIYNWGAPPLMSLELSFCENSMVPLR